MDITLTILVLATVAGVAAGMLAGLFGVGGGILFVPAFVILFGFTQLDAQATSLAAIIPVAIVGAWRLSGEKDIVNWRAAAVMGCGAAVGVLVGAEFATRVPDVALSQAFGVVLLLIGGEMIIAAVRRLKAAPRL